jgi:predicted histone-like DNA-binding protein
MATKKIEMQYNLRQLNNENNNAHLLWFPKAVRRSTLSLRGLSDHISDHGSIYTRDVVQGVLTKFTSCITELVAQGVAVKLDGLGTCYPTLEAKGAETPVGYNIEEYLKGVHIRFQPEGCDDDNITSREMKKKVIMQQNMIFDLNGVPKKVKDGQLVDYGADDDEDNDDNTNNNEG